MALDSSLWASHLLVVYNSFSSLMHQGIVECSEMDAELFEGHDITIGSQLGEGRRFRLECASKAPLNLP